MSSPPARRGGAVQLALLFAVGVVVALGALWWLDRLPGDEEEAVEPLEVSTPRTIGDFSLDRSEAAKKFVRDVERELTAQSEGSTVHVGAYAGPRGRVVFVGSQFSGDSTQANALGADAGDAVRDYLTEIGLVDLRAAGVGERGGALVCAHEKDDGPVNCAWGHESGALVSLRFATGELATASVRDAAAVTRTFLDATVTPVA